MFDAYVNKEIFSGSPSEGIVHSGVWKHLNKKGKFIYADISSHPIYFDNRDCRLVVATDATEKMRYQEEAIRAKNSLEALINNTEDQIWFG